MEIDPIFLGIAKEMLNKFDSITASLPHPGVKGSAREEILSQFLLSYLPGKYTLGKGHIRDEKGSLSAETDIIIFNKDDCPLLLSSEEHHVYPVEPIYGVIEVKSVLNSKTLRQAFNNIRVLKQLDRENGPIASIVFAFRSGWKTDAIKKAVSCYLDLLEEDSINLAPDLVCLLDSGLFHLMGPDGSAAIYSVESERFLIAYHKLEKPTLVWFFIKLLELLGGQHTVEPNYFTYSGYGIIGLVTQHMLSSK